MSKNLFRIKQTALYRLSFLRGVYQLLFSRSKQGVLSFCFKLAIYFITAIFWPKIVKKKPHKPKIAVMK